MLELALTVFVWGCIPGGLVLGAAAALDAYARRTRWQAINEERLLK